MQHRSAGYILSEACPANQELRITIGKMHRQL